VPFVKNTAAPNVDSFLQAVYATSMSKKIAKLAEVNIPTQILSCTFASQDGSTDNFGQECKLTVKCSQYGHIVRLISST